MHAWLYYDVWGPSPANLLNDYRYFTVVTNSLYVHELAIGILQLLPIHFMYMSVLDEMSKGIPKFVKDFCNLFATQCGNRVKLFNRINERFLLKNQRTSRTIH